MNIAREIFASSSAYTQIFTYVTDMLTALGSTTGPLPSDQVSTASILSSIAPVGSSISSQADVQSLEAKVEEMSETLSALMAQVVINTAQTAKVVESSVSTLSNKIDANTRS